MQTKKAKLKLLYMKLLAFISLPFYFRVVAT